jgi:hypothetical protein
MTAESRFKGWHHGSHGDPAVFTSLGQPVGAPGTLELPVEHGRLEDAQNNVDMTECPRKGFI